MKKSLRTKSPLLQRWNPIQEFAACLDKLIRYRGAESNDLYLLHPDKIIEECIEKNNVKLCSFILNSFEKQSVEDDIKDLCFDHQTMKVSFLRSFLKRHSYSNMELNRKDVDDMRKDVHTVQLNIVKRLDRSTAETLLDSGEIHLPEGYDNRSRFFSSLFPSIASYRICHWKYDDCRGCYMVKRTTGATHILYSTFEVARLTATDLYELASLPLHNPSRDQKANDFANFLKSQKAKDFAAVNFDHPNSIRPTALQFEGVQPFDTREFLFDLYLCMQFERVPRKSPVNLLDNLKKWYFDGRTFEFVFKREDEEPIRIYHPQELNLFTRDDLVKLTQVRASGKQFWNASIYEFTEDIIKKLIDCIPTDQDMERMRIEYKEKRKAELLKKIASEGPFSGGIRIFG